DADTLKELRKRLKRAAIRLGAAASADPLALAKEQLATLGRQHRPLTEKTLHQYRVTGKRARYLAEVATQDADAKYMIEQLTHMQDVLGDWHDWLKLTRSAEKLHGSEHASALVAALRNITQAKFRHAIIVLSETRAALAGNTPRPIDTVPRRRNPASADSGYAAVA
ncbi:MAG: CHAD domain-containing protein, partial [Acidobacteriales bacterium]|nr:CHAD domain-containing protein [Terriglobales bacterium]